MALKFTFNILAVFILTACGTVYVSNEATTGYNLAIPDGSFILNGKIHEVSGLTDIDMGIVACVQDENGIVFIYDLIKNEIKNQIVFGADGDYEGITRVGKTIYILRSDGTLFEILDYESPALIINSYVTGIPADNNEGLCYDKDNNRILIASKGKIAKGRELKEIRVIYSFDLKNKTLSNDPVFSFDIQDIKTFVLNNEINVPTRTKKSSKEPIIRFMASAIAIHPFTKKLFVLSASEHLLFIFNMNGNIEYVEQLNPDMFNKPEGITFLKNGDMLITNEGEDKKPTLLRFNYRMSKDSFTVGSPGKGEL